MREIIPGRCGATGCTQSHPAELVTPPFWRQTDGTPVDQYRAVCGGQAYIYEPWMTREVAAPEAPATPPAVLEFARLESEKAAACEAAVRHVVVNLRRWLDAQLEDGEATGDVLLALPAQLDAWEDQYREDALLARSNVAQLEA